jgi:hypothetical protein
MFIKFKFRPTIVDDFLLKLSLDESEPGTGAYVLPFSNEKEVYERFGWPRCAVPRAMRRAPLEIPQPTRARAHPTPNCAANAITLEASRV